MIQEQVLTLHDKTIGFSLEKLSEKYLDKVVYVNPQMSIFDSPDLDVEVLPKATAKTFKYVGNKPFTKQQLLYAAKDVEILPEIYKRQVEQLELKGLVETARIENSFVSVLANQELNGLPLNIVMWKTLHEENIKERDRVRDELIHKVQTIAKKDEEVGRLTKHLFDQDATLENFIPVSLTSSSQVAQLLQAIGIDTYVIDKEMSLELERTVFKQSVDRRVLTKYKDDPIVSLYIKYKGLDKFCTSYGTAFLDKINPESGRLHSNYKQLLKSSRTASSSPNLQQIPSNPGDQTHLPYTFRECFTAPEGYSFIVADYAGQELRVLAYYCQEQRMIDAFKNDDDLHSLTASMIFSRIEGKPIEVSKTVNSHYRKYGKVLNFGII